MTAPETSPCQCFRCQFILLLEPLVNLVRRQVNVLETQRLDREGLDFLVELFQVQSANNHIRRMIEDWKVYEDMLDQP
jgi:hypothetical protein